MFSTDFIVSSIENNSILPIKEAFFRGDLKDISWSWVIRKLSTPLSAQQLYELISGQTPPLCTICNVRNVSSFVSFEKGYNKYCSKSCAKKDPIVQQKKIATQQSRPGWKEEMLSKMRSTCMEKYGHSSALKNETVKEKRRNSNQKKYGANEVLASGSSIRTRLTSQVAVNKFWGRVSSFSDILPLFCKEDFTNDEKEYKWKCIACERIFTAHARDGSIPKCQSCFPRSSSRGEREILQFVMEIVGKDADVKSRHKLNGIELDIFIPSKSLAIEYNGIYWHSEGRGTPKNYHLDKLNLCKDNCIRLLQFWDYQWENKTDVVKSIISNALGLSSNKIYARKCSTMKIDEATAASFLQDNHLSGNARGSALLLGLYYGGALVQVATFGKSRFGAKTPEIEMFRLCAAKNHTVVGGASRLIKEASKCLSAVTFISFCDKMAFSGNTYAALGFSKVSEGKPSSWYFSSDGKLKHRSSFQKKKLMKILGIDHTNKTEFELAQLLKLNRVWDCGSSKWVLDAAPKVVL